MSFILQPWHLFFAILAGLVNRRRQEIIEFQRTQIEVLLERLGQKRVLLNDDQRRRLAVKGKAFGRTSLAEYAYVGAGHIHGMALPQPGLSLTRGLDRFDRTTDLHWTNNAQATVERLGHGYDAAGNRLYRENVLADSNGVDLDEFYTYYPTNRLAAMIRGDLNAAKTGLETNSEVFSEIWGFDATGNWRLYYRDEAGLGNWDPLQQRTHNEANEIETIGATIGTDWADPAHDRAGNMVTLPQPETPDERYRAVYDAWNRLVRLEDLDSESGSSGSSSSGGAVATVAEYDGRHFRIVKRAAEEGGASSSSSSSSSSSGSIASADRHFYYNNAWQVVEERVDGDCERQYVWGLRYIDDLVLRDRDTDENGSLEERLYAVQDANWNIVALANSSGAIQERFIYSAYGTPSVLNADFTAKAAGTAFDWEFLFTGRRLDGESGLMYYRYRVYHPGVGRFISRDPAEGDLNLYRYVSNGPISFVDPSGLITVKFEGEFLYTWLTYPHRPAQAQRGPGGVVQFVPAGPRRTPHRLAQEFAGSFDFVCRGATGRNARAQNFKLRNREGEFVPGASYGGGFGVVVEVTEISRLHMRSYAHEPIEPTEKAWKALGCPSNSRGTIQEVDVLVAWTKLTLTASSFDLPLPRTKLAEFDFGAWATIHEDDYAAIIMRYQIACCCGDGKEMQNYKFVGASYLGLWDDAKSNKAIFNARLDPGAKNWIGHTPWSRKGTKLVTSMRKDW